MRGSVKVVFNALLLVLSHFQIVCGSFQNVLFYPTAKLVFLFCGNLFFSSSERRGLSLVVRKSNDFEPQQTSLQNSFPLFLSIKRQKLDTAIVFVNKFLLFVNGFLLSPPPSFLSSCSILARMVSRTFPFRTRVLAKILQNF